MKKHTCPGCGGKRTYTRTVPNVRKYGGVEYVSSIQPTKTLIFQCAICGGSGRVDCKRCADTGYWEEYDYATGEFEGLYPCDCAAGEQARIDADKAAWEESLPDYTALHEANIAAGKEPW